MKKWMKRSTAGGLCLSGLPPSLRCLSTGAWPGSGLECYLERVEKKGLSGISGVLTLLWSST